jgi:hypothetical protein
MNIPPPIITSEIGCYDRINDFIINGFDHIVTMIQNFINPTPEYNQPRYSSYESISRTDKSGIEICRLGEGGDFEVVSP